jgi:hypothetical protein
MANAFSVSSNGSSVETAAGPQQLLANKRPLVKLDTTKTQSFQTISILFNHEPPQPSPSTFVSDTLIYQFAHGYNYIPTTWMAWQNPAPAYPGAPGSGGTATTFNAFGDDTAAYNIPSVGGATQLSLLADVAYNDPGYGFTGNFSDAFLYMIVDATNVSIYVRKVANIATSGGAIVPVYLVGVTVNLRVYVFVEPVLT